MSLEKILEKILKDARAEADAIIQESRKKASEIKKAAEEESSRLVEALAIEEERKTQLESSRIVTQARLEGRLRILSCKKELIDEVLDKAFQKANPGKAALKRTVVLKDGKKEEEFEEERLKEELRPKVEQYIAEVLKL